MSGLPGIFVSSQTTSAPLIVHPEQNILWQAAPAYALGLICTVSPGASLTYTVQVTADPNPSNTGFWNNHDVLQGMTVSANSNIGYPITGIRLVVSAWSVGSVNLGIARWP